MVGRNKWQLLLATVLLAVAPLWIPCDVSASPASTQSSDHSLAGRLELAADGRQLTGRPVVLKARLTNIGATPISYWFAGPGDYPSARHFRIYLTGQDGQTRAVVPTNGQYIRGSGMNREVKPGAMVEVPLALAPLPDGTWSVRVGSDEEYYLDQPSGKREVFWPAMPRSVPVKIEITQNAAAVAAWDRQLLNNVRQHNPFAKHLATAYHVDFVINAAISDLVGDDPKLAVAAADTLYFVRPLPPSAEKAIESAIDSQLALAPDRIDPEFLAYVLELAGEFPTGAMLEKVLAVAHCPFQWAVDVEMHYAAVSTLRYFPQNRAVVELKAFLNDKSQIIREGARAALDHPWPPQLRSAQQ